VRGEPQREVRHVDGRGGQEIDRSPLLGGSTSGSARRRVGRVMGTGRRREGTMSSMRMIYVVALAGLACCGGQVAGATGEGSRDSQAGPPADAGSGAGSGSRSKEAGIAQLDASTDAASVCNMPPASEMRCVLCGSQWHCPSSGYPVVTQCSADADLPHPPETVQGGSCQIGPPCFACTSDGVGFVWNCDGHIWEYSARFSCS
jgi:hypothetical protein